MYKLFASAALTFFVVATTMLMTAAPGVVAAEASVKDTTIDPQIESLLAMQPGERRAELEKLAPEERRGLWMKLRHAKAQKTNAGKAAATYADLTPQPVSATPAETWTERAVGTISYDNGSPTTSFGGGAIIGNRFDTHTGIPVFASGTISTVQAVVVPGPSQTSSSAGFVILGPQTVGGAAFALFSSFTAATGAIDTVSFTGLGVNYTGSSFFVLFGDFASSYVPVFSTGTTLGQGHHGVVGYTGGTGPNITGTFDFGGTLNSLIRVSGNIVPVELMTFDVM